ncbi:MAG: ABC transporter substrate-binding protein, partial [Anaerolineae bacterium]|nr:ABC transporter substrate-binding protein [Anaerolineae bacterium]
MRRLALLIIVALALTACSGATSQPAPDANAPAPTRSIVVAIGGESEEGYDPLLGWGRYGSPLFQSTLLKRDSQLNLVHDLATDVQVSDDGRTWTVTIRPDARFSDGSAVTASDVAFTFLTAAGTAGLAPDLSALEAAEAPDDHT